MQLSNKGFTLVELAIVMTIIGLLIGGVLKGQQLMENARVNATIQRVTSYQAALTTFKETYGAMPGDMLNAQDRIPGCNSGSYCLNGDGNSQVGLATDITAMPVNNSETTQFWKHLAMTDMISGVVPTANTARPQWGETHPAAPIAGGFEFYYDPNFYMAATSGHFLRLSNAGILPGGAAQEASAGSGTAAMSPRMAARVDRKMDDGWPASGSVFVWDSGNFGCDNMLDGSVGIDETQTARNCIMFFRFD